jgi:hypothetical protein
MRAGGKTMSTLVYAALTSRRIQAPKDESTAKAPPGLGTYVDTLAALVPGEVLAVHAAIISLTSTKGGMPLWVFWALVGLSVLLYVFGRIGTKAPFEPLDLLRALIPPLAFVGWTLIQKPTAFDANWPGVPEVTRDIIAVIGAAVLAPAAALLGIKSDRTESRT